ncbi:uncharacterized endoplasmic reticulum membrane protein C16E8.02 [Amborella trichopoda]|uniref:uncharacterized endoplasmic reticulum membrane protein C16E8.02 n=1 Tax=Amborella trichopoda TaxID=13333 RepID=UPI0009C168C6|nr:uncharacterized endoplasmic reticulum membrane protein C16E8.02 [Amborella trichopoda]|eukprot:XP_020521402.1 uncharacterized endoplasmic reticulum membrane protein C16E8.02 [Amborella trichopoda]
MARGSLFDLEKHFAFYGAYHSDPINIIIHTLFVWPIFYTNLILMAFTPSLFPIFDFHENLVPNLGFFFALVYGIFYVSLDKKAGSLAALLCLLCWVNSAFLAHRLGFSLAWKVRDNSISLSSLLFLFCFMFLNSMRLFFLTSCDHLMYRVLDFSLVSVVYQLIG